MHTALLNRLLALFLVAVAGTAGANSGQPTKAPDNGTASVPAVAGKPASTAPKRLAFPKDKMETSEKVVLPAGGVKQFVFRGRIGQIFMVDADSKDLAIRMTKGKDSAQMTEPGHYDSTLIANGDFVFQVKNTSNKDVTAQLKVLISDTGISKR
jgi:hypothetical protein